VVVILLMGGRKSFSCSRLVGSSSVRCLVLRSDFLSPSLVFSFTFAERLFHMIPETVKIC
jgi:hypothetical protein